MPRSGRVEVESRCPPVRAQIKGVTDGWDAPPWNLEARAGLPKRHSTTRHHDPDVTARHVENATPADDAEDPDSSATRSATGSRTTSRNRSCWRRGGSDRSRQSNSRRSLRVGRGTGLAAIAIRRQHRPVTERWSSTPGNGTNSSNAWPHARTRSRGRYPRGACQPPRRGSRGVRGLGRRRRAPGGDHHTGGDVAEASVRRVVVGQARRNRGRCRCGSRGVLARGTDVGRMRR